MNWKENTYNVNNESIKIKEIMKGYNNMLEAIEI